MSYGLIGYLVDLTAEGEKPVQTKNLLNEHAKEADVRLSKKQYRKPVLKTYGPVKHLTQSIGSANGDGGQNMMV